MGALDRASLAKASEPWASRTLCRWILPTPSIVPAKQVSWHSK